MKNKEKYLTNFSEAKRKKATQKYNIIKPFILGEQSLSSISKSKGIALSTLYRYSIIEKATHFNIVRCFSHLLGEVILIYQVK